MKLLKVAKIEVLEEDDAYDLNVEEDHTYLLACGVMSHNSAFTASASAYQTHLYLKVPKLSTICEGIQESTPLTATFVGLRFSDAFNLLWTPLMEIIDHSPWFTEHFELLDHYSNMYGKELYKKRDVFIRYAHRNLELYPSGPTKRGLRGRTRFLAATDEIGWFPIAANTDGDEDNDERERANADEVHTALDRSLLTVRTEVLRLLQQKHYNTIPTGIQICVSSPASERDMIWRLVQGNKHSKTNLAVHLPTWEMNPFYPRNHPYILAAYKKNASKAERDYGAVPPKSAMAFIEDKSVSKCFTSTNRAQIQLVKATVDGQHYTGAKLAGTQPRNEVPASIMAIDAGYSNNAFALTIGHRSGQSLNVDVLIEVPPLEGTVLHYNAIYLGLIKPLIEKFNVRMLFADRWQSIAILHRAQAELKVEVSMYSAKYMDFVLVKSLLDSRTLILPKTEKDLVDDEATVAYPKWFRGAPATHMLFQTLTVKEIGQSITKGDGYTDDLFRATVLLASRAFNQKIEDKMSKFLAKKREAKAVVSSRYLSQAGGSAYNYGEGSVSRQIVVRRR